MGEGRRGRRWGLIYAGNADSMESCQIKLAGELAWARAGGSRGADRDRGILDPTQFSPSWDIFFPLSSLLPSLHNNCTPHYPLRSLSVQAAASQVFNSHTDMTCPYPRSNSLRFTLF